MTIVGLSWVRVERYCELVGEPIKAVLDRIRAGQWAAGKQYKRTGPRTLWVNLIGASEWVSMQPHVEASCPPVLKSEKEQQESAYA